MADLINRQMAIDTIADYERDSTAPIDYKAIIKALPTVDAVEVIRCAECKWFQCNMSMDGYLPEGVDEFECRHWCGSCDPVDFCSFAERRQDV